MIVQHLSFFFIVLTLFSVQLCFHPSEKLKLAQLLLQLSPR